MIYKFLLKSCTLFILILLVASISYSAQPEPDTGAKADDKDKEEICSLIKKEISAGDPAKKVVSSSLKKGHSLCYVVRCAIDAGGNLQDIVAGAMDAGSTSDVISICTPLVTDPPKGTRGATILSPSSFR